MKAKKRETKGLVITDEIKEAFKKVIEFEYYACWNEVQNGLTDIKKVFFHDEINRLTKMMNKFPNMHIWKSQV